MRDGPRDCTGALIHPWGRFAFHLRFIAINYDPTLINLRIPHAAGYAAATHHTQ